MNVHSSIYRLDKLASSLLALNERLKEVNTILVGAKNVGDRPEEPPKDKVAIKDVPAPVEQFNFADAFDFQYNSLVYLLDYAHDMINILESITKKLPEGQVEGGKGPAPDSFRRVAANR